MQLDTNLITQRSATLRCPFDKLEIINGPNSLTQLLAGDADIGAKRRELISSIRGGKHVELAAPAITFRQRDGSPNTNFLRHAPGELAAFAASYVKKPVLLDHNKWQQRARIGTIVESALATQADGWSALRQTLHIVKPDAVISVLDGTLDRFSIGWRPMGPVLCTAHRKNVLSRAERCGCWPGDKVTVDGKLHVVEYEFQRARGTETSGVNDPAVEGTSIEGVRAMLAVADGEAPIGENSLRAEALAAAAEQLGLDVAELDAAAETLYAAEPGDDTDAALHSVAAQLGLDVKELEATMERLR